MLWEQTESSHVTLILSLPSKGDIVEMNCSARRQPEKSIQYSQQETNLPLSLGANFHDDPICRATLRKSHTTALANQIPESDPSPHTSYSFTGYPRSSDAIGQFTTAAENFPKPATPPEEVVLRFLGFIEETIRESPDESVRIRKVALLYHTADGTILLREGPQINSGMSQGVLVKRQRVPLPEGSGHVSAEHIQIGSTVDVFRRLVHIVDMDEATRTYYRDVLKMEAPELPLPWPEEKDTYNAKVKAHLTYNPKKSVPTADMDLKRALESIAGGAIAKHSPDDVHTAQQFLSNKINEHLQFLALWDDRNKLSGDLRFAVIKYYLENDTLEIVEDRQKNSGREGSHKLLMRQRVPRPGAPPDPAVQEGTYGQQLRNNYLTFQDLDVGIELEVHSHTYLVYEADQFTREWYKKNAQRELRPAVDVTSIVKKDHKEPPKHYPPPHVGFGSEEDSLRNWKYLLLKPARPDYAKLQQEGGKVLVFSATLEPPVAPEDEGRQFVIAFFCATDEVEINEKQVRNSGIVGGKFLAKGRHLRKLPGGRTLHFTKEDFVVGQPVTVAGHTFRLLDLDERSRKQLEGTTDPVTEDRVRELILLFKQLLHSKFYRMHEAYRVLAPEGALTVEEVLKFFHASCAQVTEEEAEHVVDNLAPGKKGRLTFDDFVQVMNIPNSINMDDSSLSLRSVRGVRIRPPEEQAELRQTHEEAANAATAVRMKKLLIGKIVQRAGTVHDIFRLLSGHTRQNARLRCSDFRVSIREQLQINVSAAEEEVLAKLLFPSLKPDDEIDFTTFFEFVESG